MGKANILILPNNEKNTHQFYVVLKQNKKKTRQDRVKLTT